MDIIPLPTRFDSIPGLDYIAIDVELANPKYESICSIGLAFVENGNVQQIEHYLIKPHAEYRIFSPMHKRLHGITEDAVKNSPELIDLWPAIQHHFDGNKLIVAHNAGFDVSVLRHSLQAYNVELPYFDYCCTMQLAKSTLTSLTTHTLPDLLRHYEYTLSHHHHAAYDAYHCAIIGRYLLPQCHSSSYSKNQLDNPRSDRSAKNKKFFKLQSKEADLTGIAWDDLDATAGPDFFQDKRFVVTGEFAQYSREVLLELLVSKGGIKQSSVSGKTDFFIVGDGAGWSKVEKVKAMRDQGQDIQIISQEELYQILEAIS